MDDTNNGEVTTTSEVIEQPVIEQQPTLSNKELNLVALRKRLESEEEARKAAERRAQEIEQRLNQMTQQQPAAPVVIEEDDLSVDNEDYVQAKHVKSSNKKIKTKIAATEQKIQELEQKLAYVEAKVYTDALKDFNKVVSDDNLKTLAALYPEDYQTMMANPNLKAKSKTAYNMIKNYGIIDNEAPRDNRQFEQRMAANKQKPQSASVASPQSGGALSKFDEHGRRMMSETERDRILAEVERKKSISY